MSDEQMLAEIMLLSGWVAIFYVNDDQYMLCYQFDDDKPQISTLNSAQATEVLKIKFYGHGGYDELYEHVASNRRHLLPKELVAELVAQELIDCDY